MAFVSASFLNLSEPDSLAKLILVSIDRKIFSATISLSQGSSLLFGLRKVNDQITYIGLCDNDSIVCLQISEVELETNEGSRPLFILIVAFSSGSVHVFDVKDGVCSLWDRLDDSQPIYQFDERIDTFNVGPLVHGFESVLPFVATTDEKIFYGCISSTNDGIFCAQINKTKDRPNQGLSPPALSFLPSHFYQFEVCRNGSIVVDALDDRSKEEITQFRGEDSYISSSMDTLRGTYWIASSSGIYELCIDRESVIWIFFMLTGQHQQALCYSSVRYYNQ